MKIQGIVILTVKQPITHNQQHTTFLPISAIIITRNGWEVSKTCIEGILKEPVKEVIVVDNGSTDETVEELKKIAKKETHLRQGYGGQRRLKVIENNRNTGFAEGNNIGLKHVTQPFVLFLNNDTIIHKNFLQPLLKFLLTHKQTAAVQPLILFPDETIDSIGSYYTPTGFLYHRAHRQKPKKSLLHPTKVYSLKGACMLWKKSVLDEIGIFDESYFAYFEETELCHRAVNAGYHLFFVPNSIITHLGGFTSNAMDSTFVQFHNYKNRILTYFRHLKTWEVITMFPIHLFLCEAFTFMQLFRQPKVSLSMQKGILSGTLIGLIDRLTIKRKRNEISTMTKYPDVSYYFALLRSLQNFDKIW